MNRPIISPKLSLLALSLLVAAPAVATAQGHAGGPSTQAQTAGQKSPAKPMTEQQKKDVLASVDSIAQFASSDSHLQMKHPVKKAILSREDIRKMLDKKFDEDEGAKRLQREEAVLKKFGLLDRDFKLRPFLLALLTEQIAGFYDPKAREIYLLDWIDAEEQKPVMAHELTHALQDQHVDLDKWGSVTPVAISHNAREDNDHIARDEADTAREAVTEGQAMAVFIDYSIKSTGRTFGQLPPMGDRLREIAGSGQDSPLMQRAPLMLQQSLLFPYVDGALFAQYLLAHGGPEVAFAGALDHPPASSHEIMHPEDYVTHTPVPVLVLPDIHSVIDKEWLPYDVGVMGEQDVHMTAELFGGRQMADAVSSQWAGGIYYAAQKRSAVTDAQKASTASVGVLYYSQWKDDDSARSFLRLYANALGRKYHQLKRVTLRDGDDDHQQYETEEGDVILNLNTNGLFISEGFSVEDAHRLEAQIRGAQGSGPVQNAATPQHELTGGIAATLAGFGVPRAALTYNKEQHP